MALSSWSALGPAEGREGTAGGTKDGGRSGVDQELCSQQWCLLI